MTYPNEGGFDRTLRIFLGVVLAYLGWQAGTGATVGIVMLAVGILAVVTGVVGWCPAYQLFGWSTLHRKA